MVKIRYRKVSTHIWNDQKFRDLSRDAQFVFFFLLTAPAMTSIGAMRHTMAGMAAELGLDLEAFREGFRECSERGMVRVDEGAAMVWLPNFLKHNPPESPNVVKAWAGVFHSLPECDLKSEAGERLAQYVSNMPEASRRLLKGYEEAFRKAMPNQGTGSREQGTGNTPQPPSGCDEGRVDDDNDDARPADDERPVPLAGFDAFWSAYPGGPRKAAKLQCQGKWKTLGCASHAPAIATALAKAKSSRDWTKDDGQFIPAPLTWLNQRRWEADTVAGTTDATAEKSLRVNINPDQRLRFAQMHIGKERHQLAPYEIPLYEQYKAAHPLPPVAEAS